jgi:phosphoglycerol transferase MdoB-like AlkP superfamily enzyme
MWSMNKMHPRLGFQQSFFQEKYQIHERIGEWMADKDFFIQTIPILKAQKKPFLAYMITSSNHHPFEIPKELRALNLGELEDTYEGNYLHSVHYFDQAFGKLIDLLKANELLDESVVVLYGDHQAYLDGTKLAGQLGLSKMSPYDSFRLRKRVPLLIRLPKALAAGPRSTTGGHLDIAPTILSLLGIFNENIVMFGKDLTQEQDSFVVFRDGSFADGTHLFINGFGATSALHCYEMKSGRKIDCGRLEERTRSATEQLEISDLIIRGNLIPYLMAARPMKSD